MAVAYITSLPRPGYLFSKSSFLFFIDFTISSFFSVSESVNVFSLSLNSSLRTESRSLSRLPFLDAGFALGFAAVAVGVGFGAAGFFAAGFALGFAAVGVGVGAVSGVGVDVVVLLPPSSILRATFLAPLDTALAPAPIALFRPDLSADPILPRSPGLLDPVSVELDEEELVCGAGAGVGVGDGEEELLPEEEPPLPLSYPLENSLPAAFTPLTAAPAT